MGVIWNMGGSAVESVGSCLVRTVSFGADTTETVQPTSWNELAAPPPSRSGSAMTDISPIGTVTPEDVNMSQPVWNQ